MDVRLHASVSHHRITASLCGEDSPAYLTDAPAMLQPRLLCIGGEDHDLRIPFLLTLEKHGIGAIAAGTGSATPFKQAGIQYHSYRLERFVDPLSDRHTLRGLAALIKEVRPDIIQSFDTKPNLLVPLAARRLRDLVVVRTINGMGWLYSSRTPLALSLRPVYRALHRLAARGTTATIFQNSVDQDYFRRHKMAGGKEIRLIPGSGVDIDGFDLAQKHGPSGTELREILRIGRSQVVITVTRLTRQKGVATLLRAAKLVHRQCPTVRFLLVGPRETEGSQAIPQTDIDRHAPYVIATGPRSDVPALLGLANVFAFPTEYREGVPRALLEAALARLPIVTTDMPGCSDVIRDGWSGIVVPPRSPEALAAGILRLLRDPPSARIMADRASERVRQDFNLDLTAARYMDLYLELLRQRHASCRQSMRLENGANDREPGA